MLPKQARLSSPDTSTQSRRHPSVDLAWLDEAAHGPHAAGRHPARTSRTLTSLCGGDTRAGRTNFDPGLTGGPRNGWTERAAVREEWVVVDDDDDQRSGLNWLPVVDQLDCDSMSWVKTRPSSRCRVSCTSYRLTSSRIFWHLYAEQRTPTHTNHIIPPPSASSQPLHPSPPPEPLLHWIKLLLHPSFAPSTRATPVHHYHVLSLIHI